jgi:hypothetical protein
MKLAGALPGFGNPRGSVTDWFDDPENGPPTSAARLSWMLLYNVTALIGAEVLGVIGGILHVLPA